MKEINNHCVILCDYPIKTMGYIKMLAALGETSVITLSSPPTQEARTAKHGKLLIVDMNWGQEDEEMVTEYILETFPHAVVLFMKEETNTRQEHVNNHRDVIFLGKLASLQQSKACLNKLLKRAKLNSQQQLKLFETTS